MTLRKNIWIKTINGKDWAEAKLRLKKCKKRYLYN